MGWPSRPSVKTNVTEEVTLIENLPKGNYQVKAEYGGITKTRDFQISEGTLAIFRIAQVRLPIDCVRPPVDMFGISTMAFIMPR